MTKSDKNARGSAIWLAAKRAGLDNFGNIEFFHGKPFILVDSIYESSYLEALTN